LVDEKVLDVTSYAISPADFATAFAGLTEGGEIMIESFSGFDNPDQMGIPPLSETEALMLLDYDSGEVLFERRDLQDYDRKKFLRVTENEVYYTIAKGDFREPRIHEVYRYDLETGESEQVTTFETENLLTSMFFIEN
jgi:hypothetical protein